MRQNHTVAVLFARGDSIYKSFLFCDVYDKIRDALTFPGGMPVVAHPPCGAWGRLRCFAHVSPGEKELALWAIEKVRLCGGVLEHPAGSSLWKIAGLPPLGKTDSFGGFTLQVEQFWWGHWAAKKTWLYICGVDLCHIPAFPLRFGEPTHVIETTKKHNHRPSVTKSEREATPVDFALWLCELATRGRQNYTVAKKIHFKERCIVTPLERSMGRP